MVAARLEIDWTLPVDISFGVGEPEVPIAQPWSVARLRLEQALPGLVEEARRRLAELDARQAAAGGPAGSEGRR